MTIRALSSSVSTRANFFDGGCISAAAAQNAAPPTGRSGRAAPGRGEEQTLDDDAAGAHGLQRPAAAELAARSELRSTARSYPHLQDQIQKQQFSTERITSGARELGRSLPRPNSATPLTESSFEQARTQILRSGASGPRIPASSDQIRVGKPRGAARIEAGLKEFARKGSRFGGDGGGLTSTRVPARSGRRRRVRIGAEKTEKNIFARRNWSFSPNYWFGDEEQWWVTLFGGA